MRFLSVGRMKYRVIPSRFDDVCQFTNITSTTLDPPQEDPQITTTVVEKQVEFAEAAPADISILSQPAPMDLTYVETLRGFLERPYPVLSGDWSGDSVAGTTLVTLDPMKVYLNLPLIIGKLRGFSYLRAGLRIELRINGTRFHYGQLVSAFRPLAGSFQTYSASQLTVYAGTMFPSVISDPGPSQVNILEVPYCYPYHFLSITDTSSHSIGTLALQVLSPLRVVSQTTVPVVNFTVYVSLVNPVLAGFTALPIQTPLRSPLLEEQSLDSSARVTPEANNMVATDINDISFHAGMDSNNSVAALPQYIGNFAGQMDFSHIFTKPNFELTRTWSSLDIAGAALLDLPVCPVRQSLVNTFLHILNQQNVYWRGSLRYHLRIVASGFHSGRLLVAWEPSFTTLSLPTLPDLSNRISMVIDIQETTDVYFTIPYMARSPWLETLTAPASTASLANHNGKLSITVLNPLATPSGEISSVDIFLWKYGSSDLEFAVPKVTVGALADWPIPNALAELEEQCLDAPISDSKFGALDGSFSVPGAMSMGERISSVRDMLLKKSNIRNAVTTSATSYASVYASFGAVNSSAFVQMSRMYLFARGAVKYAVFISNPRFGMYDAYDIAPGMSFLTSGALGVVQVTSACPNAMITVPYYTNRLFHTTAPPTEQVNYPEVGAHVRSGVEEHTYTFWASAGNDFMFGYLIPPPNTNLT